MAIAEKIAYVFIGLGANLESSAGSPIATIHEVQAIIAQWSAQKTLSSSIWQSDPIDCPPGSPLFYNAVMAFIPDASETPENLLVKLKALEENYGRKFAAVRNSARPLDLDILVFKNVQQKTATLEIPHPRAVLRRFVLEPLIEVAPQLLIPGQQQPLLDLLAGLQSQRIQKVQS